MGVVYRDSKIVGEIAIELRIIEFKRFNPSKGIVKIVVFPAIEIVQTVTKQRYIWPTDEIVEDIKIDPENLEDSIKEVEKKEEELVERAKDQFKKIVETIRRLGSMGFEIGGRHIFFPY